jgi:hypothetical protein
MYLFVFDPPNSYPRHASWPAVRETDIAALEADIDAAVYDLFDLTADERAVIEVSLDVF